jgi:hypothetical protein
VDENRAGRPQSFNRGRVRRCPLLLRGSFVCLARTVAGRHLLEGRRDRFENPEEFVPGREDQLLPSADSFNRARNQGFGASRRISSDPDHEVVEVVQAFRLAVKKQPDHRLPTARPVHSHDALPPANGRQDSRQTAALR